MKSFGVNELGINRLGNIGIVSSSWSQYYYFNDDDGETYMRKGVRFVDPDQKFGVDIRLTDDPGFDGVEDTDFEMIYPIIL